MIQAYKGLLTKDIKVMKNYYFLGMGLILLAVVGGGLLTKYFKEPNIMAAVMLMVLFAHIMYIPLFILASLNIEAKTQTWLHNPNSAALLLLSKLGSALVAYLFSICFTLLLAATVYFLYPSAEFYTLIQGSLLTNTLYMSIAITFVTIYFAVWILFYWSFFHSLKNVSVAGALRWPILILFWIIQTIAGNYITSSKWFEKIISIGVIEADAKWLSIDLEVNQSSASIGMNPTVEISLVHGLIYTLLVIFLFYLSAWLIEKKVEV